MIWGLLVKSDAPVERVINHLAAGMKSLTNRTISNKFNSFIVALADNRPLITTRLVLVLITVAAKKPSKMILIRLFSNMRKNPARIFAYRDHSRPSEAVHRAWLEFKKLDPKISAFDVPTRNRYRREILLKRLNLLADQPGLEDFQAVNRDHLPKDYHSFKSFITLNATLEFSKSKIKLVEWTKPIKLKLVFLPDSIT